MIYLHMVSKWILLTLASNGRLNCVLLDHKEVENQFFVGNSEK